MKNLMDKIKLPADRFEIRLSGSGGQGMILAAVILCDAIGAGSSKSVAQTQSYGPEARGGRQKPTSLFQTVRSIIPRRSNSMCCWP